MNPVQRARHAALKIYPMCGRQAALRYAQQWGVVRLYVIARQLQAAGEV